MSIMQELFEWIRNITYYLIFVTVVINLLPNKKYEKYIKFFTGMVLILLVLKPVTDGLRLDDTLAYYFEAISLKTEAGELTGKISKMDEIRLENMIARYEEAVGMDLKSMAETAGFGCRESKAEIDKNQESSTFGNVIRVSMLLFPDGAEKTEEVNIGEGIDPVKKVQKVEGVNINTEGSESENKGQEDVRKKKQEENSQLSGLRRRIAEYYDLEEQDIEIQVEDG